MADPETGGQPNTPAPVAVTPAVTPPVVAPSVTATPAATPAPVEAATTLVTETPVDPNKPAEAKPVEPKADAPAAVEFKLPEDVKFNPASVEAFKKLAGEEKLTPAQAQKLVDFQVAAQREAQTQLSAIQASWEADSRKAFSQGDLNNAMAAVAVGADDEVRAFLNETKLGNHPMLIRLFARIGAQLGEDRFETGGRPIAAKRDAASVLYPENPKPN